MYTESLCNKKYSNKISQSTNFVHSCWGKRKENLKYSRLFLWFKAQVVVYCFCIHFFNANVYTYVYFCQKKKKRNKKTRNSSKVHKMWWKKRKLTKPSPTFYPFVCTCMTFFSILYSQVLERKIEYICIHFTLSHCLLTCQNRIMCALLLTYLSFSWMWIFSTFFLSSFHVRRRFVCYPLKNHEWALLVESLYLVPACILWCLVEFKY